MVKLSMAAGVFALAAIAGCASAGPLFNGRDFDGFELSTGTPAALSDVFVQRPDGVIAVTGKPSGFLASRATYTNYRLHVEYRWSGKPGNSGVLLHIASGPKDGVWPVSQQVQTKHGFNGDLLPMAGARFAEPLTTAPGAYPPIKGHTAPDSEKPAGEWNSIDVVCQDGAIDVSINGVAQNRVTRSDPASGHVGFQLEGAPYELRNVTIEPLD
ncbi:3-keto-disaccharide hydrolase [Massilia terrae]|uniref:DUF1080 domain-containing protein n=1 Tax=Massilia terrae TaxID=1811224 RepID=A0ABT2CTD1_9BURK|nr:DUF1080 domain-containing protein [Massilia terrae]MCS0657241.1 DUF1080 domain-containing protein [Massilia terrae]